MLVWYSLEQNVRKNSVVVCTVVKSQCGKSDGRSQRHDSFSVVHTEARMST